eukprot:TRINITY_DN23004_c0_g1_i1.p1 TRINITY_DN23004_c0_g1~~TRINITY_DN23004_c0_g1_i1.p1  ORF type:complete len:216 (+),score=48.37 TRINITY_DN23004_c0_g1_i1:119-766(+)
MCIRDSFETLPIALERDDVTVVHACMHPESLEILRGMNDTSVSEAFDQFASSIAQSLAADGVTDSDEIDMAEQNRNPVKVLTSGMEIRAAEPFFAGGKMRNLERAKWWENYLAEDGRLVVIGHYWRRFLSEVAPRVHELYPEGFNPTGADMFPGYGPSQLVGDKKKVICVDYAAGVRYEERGLGLPESSLGTRLGALRLPEMKIHLEDGRILDVE